jgi:hypothetical protein
MRKYSKIVLALVMAVLFITVSKLQLNEYRLFVGSLESFKNVKIKDTKIDAVYKLGFPDEVLLFPIKSSPVWVYFGKGEIDSAVQSEILSTNTSIYRSQAWTFNKLLNDSTVQIEFDQNGLVQKFTLSSYKDKNYQWEMVAGINHGDPEDAILKLGEPSSISMLGEEKEVGFKNLGLTFKLRRGKVFGVEKIGFQEEWFNLLFLSIKCWF